MRLHAFILLMLVLTVSAGRKKFRGREPMVKPKGECPMVQPFDQDFVYTYKYVAYTQHRDVASGTGSDVRITCTATIAVPRRCSGKMRVSDCQLDEGTMGPDGRMTYRPLPASAEFAREMEVSEMAFHFNGGQITGIFVDKQERTNATNIKRGILSSLQAYNPEYPQRVEVGDIFEVPQVSVYGQGVVEHRILEKSGESPSVIEITRDTSRIELPWERRQWNFIRMRNNKLNPLLSAFKNYITVTNEERFAKSRQTCRYELKRGRLVASAICEEKFPLNPTKPELTSNLFQNNPTETTVRQEITLKTPRRMTKSDRSQWDISRFDEDNIMFEEEWEETNMMYFSEFDASVALLKLIREPVNDKSPALVSKLSRRLAISSQEQIESVWAKCERECSEKEKSDGRILWVELLNSCIANDWCQIPMCSNENATSCQNALETFVRANNDKSPEVREACLTSLESIPAPSVQIIQSTLAICRAEEQTSPACARTLGTVTRNFLASCGSDCENKKPVEDAKAFLVRQLKRDCTARNEELEEVMVTCMDVIGSLGPNGRYAEDTVLTCAINPNAPTRVVIKALVAYENITEETLNSAAQTKLSTLFMNREVEIETRIICFHLLMRKNLPADLVERILTSVMDENEHPLVRQHCTDDIKTQVMIRGTVFCQFHPQVAEKCVQIITSKHWDIGIPRQTLLAKPVEKTFEMAREMFLPYINAKTNCTIRIKSVYENEAALVPAMSQLTLLATVEGRNVTIVEAALDIAGMKPVLDRILGHNTFYAELFGKLLNAPMHELYGYSKQYPALNALRKEGKYDYILSVFKSRSPIHLRVLGVDISLDSLMGFDVIRRVALGNFWQVIETLEAGFEHQAFVAGQPFLMQHATPTCIGAPIISTVEVSYILKSRLNLKANLRKMIFTPNEKAIINLAPELYVTGSISRTILEQFTKNCGTELQLKFGHGSVVACSVNTNPEGLNVVCTPKPGKTQLLYLSGKKSLAGRVTPEPSASMCQSISLRSVCTLNLCKQPASETGFAYEVDIENHIDTEYRASLAWQSKPEEQSKELVKELKVECTAEIRSDPSSKKILWSSVLSYVPSRKEVQCLVDCEWFRWRAAANMMMPRHGSSHGLFASANASGIDSLQMKYFNVFNVVPESNKRYSLQGECKWAVGEQLSGYGLRGSMEEAPEGGNTTRKAEIEVFNIAREADKLMKYEILTKKVPQGLENMHGYEVWSSIEGRVIPFFKKCETVMATYDDGNRYEKVMRVSGHFENEARNPHFFIHRMRGSWKKPRSEAYESEIYTVSNLFHWGYEATCDAKGDVIERGKLNIPSTSISYNDIVTQKNPFTYNVKTHNRPAASFIEHNFTISTLKSGDRDYDLSIGYRLWHPVNRDYYYEKAQAKYTNYKECSYCHSLKLEHPKVKLSSVSRRNGVGSYYRDEKWLKLHHSLLNYIYLHPYLSYYLINNLKDGYVDVGFNIKYEPKKDGGDMFEVVAAFLKNDASCNVEFDGNLEHVKSRCRIDTEVIPLHLDISVNASRDNENKPEVKVQCDARYSGVGCRLNGLFRLTRTNDFKCVFKSAYGAYPDYENEDILDLSFDNVHSRYDITGSYKNTYRPSSTEKSYQFVGTSERLEGGKRDLEIKALCSEEPSKTCARVSINKDNKVAEYERLVYGENYDRATIKYEDNKYKMETDAVNELLWDARQATFSLELNKNSYGIEVESRICNMSCRYSEEHGLEVNSRFSTYWLKQDIMAVVNAASAKYNIVWDSIDAGGPRISNNMSLKYVILNWDKPLDARIAIGSGPGSFRTSVKIPDFEFVYDYAIDRDESPERFRYNWDTGIVPNKITLNDWRFPIFGRDLEIKNTKVALEYRNERFSGVSVRDLSVSLHPECRGLNPVIVTGKCDISFEKVLMKMADPNRLFVIDVDVVPTTPMKHHIEIVMTIMNTKLDLLSDMHTVNNKLTMNEKCEISRISWKTKEMSPIFTFSTTTAIGETQETSNFPEISIECILTHSLPVPIIPKDNKITLTSTVSGMTTTVHSLAKLGERRTSEMSMTMNGCHNRMEIIPRYSWCLPDSMSSNWTLVMPSYRREQIMTLTKESNEWALKITADFRSPWVSEKKILFTFNSHIAVTPCPGTSRWCMPERIEFKDIEWIVPDAFLPRILLPGIFSPDTFTNIHFQHSDIVISRQLTEESSINTIQTNLRKPGERNEIGATLTATISPSKVECNMDMTAGEWKLRHELGMTCSDPTDLNSPWTYHHLLDCPQITTKTDIKASSLFTITSYEMMIKMPKGILRDFTYSYGNNKLICNLEVAIAEVKGKTTNDITWEPTTSNWDGTHTVVCPWMNMNLHAKGSSVAINSCQMTLDTVGPVSKMVVNWGEGNADIICKIGTVALELKKRGSQWNGDLKCGRIPSINQTFVLGREVEGDLVNYQIRHETQYHSCVTKFNTEGLKLKGKEMDCRMKNSEAGIKVEYIREQEGNRCRITLKTYDNNQYSCLSTPMANERNEGHLVCTKVEGTKRTDFANIPVTMEDFPCMGDFIIRDKVIFAARCVAHLYKAINYDEKQLGDEYQKLIRCSDEGICHELAKRVKSGYYSCSKELKRIAGSNMYYFTKPEITEYALYKYLRRLPGSMTIMPEWSSLSKYSPVAFARSFLEGVPVTFVHWKLGKYVEIKASAAIENQGTFMITTDYTSEKYDWLSGVSAIGVGMLDDHMVLNTTGVFAGRRYTSIFGLEGGKLHLLATEYGKTGMETEHIWLFNFDSAEHGRHNISVTMLKSGEVNFVCEALIPSNEWSNAEIKCYEGRSRQTVIGKITLPDVASISKREHIDMDSILREFLGVRSPEHRNRIETAINSYISSVGSYARDYWKMGSESSMLFRTAQYTVASIMHEAAKRDESQGVLDTVWMLSDPVFYGQLVNSLVDGDVLQIMRSVFTPVLDTLNFALEGHVATECKMEDGAIVLRASVDTRRMPLCSFDTTVRITKKSWNNILISTVTINKFSTVSANIHLEGPRVTLRKIRIGAEESRHYLEGRIVPNPEHGKPAIIQIYFGDLEGQNYACEGMRSAWASHVLHMHCFKLEGSELPPNPPASKIIGYFDLPIITRGLFSGLESAVELIERVIDPCLEDPTKILSEVYHVHDPAILERLARTMSFYCNAWSVVISEQQSEHPQPKYRDYSIASLTQKYKSYSHESMISFVKESVRSSTPSETAKWGLGAISDIVSVVYAYSLPSIRYAIAVAEYVEPHGVFNLSRCAECEIESKQTNVILSFKSKKLPALDLEQIITISPQGMINASLSNGCAWGWVECELSGMMIVPMKGKFGLSNDIENGVEVVFSPEIAEGDRPAMSFIFNAGERYCCDARIESWIRTNLKCHPYQDGRRGAPAATCDVSPMKMTKAGVGLVTEAMHGDLPRESEIGRALEKTCEFTNPQFKQALSRSLAQDIVFVADYCRNVVKGALKTWGELFNLTYSTLWSAVVDAYDWLLDLIPTIGNINMRTYFTTTKSGIENVLSWFQGLTSSVYNVGELIYNYSYGINQVLYDLPTYFPAGWSTERGPRYSRNFQNYMSILTKNILTGDHCAFGMIHANEIEQMITLNNHLYNLPRKIKKCSYLLAGDQANNHYTVLLMKGDLVINLPDTSITIDRQMRISKGRPGVNGRSEVSLPYFGESVNCERTANRLMCYTPFMTIVVHCLNDVRTGFYIRFNEVHCPHTKGLMGEGANTTEVPRMEMIDGKTARSMVEFLESYSADKSCHVTDIPPEPQESHTYCDTLFENDQWKSVCPHRRRSFMKACQTGAKSAEDACMYVKKYNRMCHMEGRPTKISPTCGLCRGQSQRTTQIDKVRFTVVMSLSRKTNRETLQDILNAVRQTADESHAEHEINFVTFGGRNEMFPPAFQSTEGKVWIPKTDPWTVPNVEFNGMAPGYESLRDTMWYTLMNLDRTVQGVGKVILFVLPEDMDLTFLPTSTVATKMNEDLIKAYLLIPNTCNMRGAKARTPYGVRQLFTTEPENICKSSPTEVANTLAYPYISRRMTCTCRVENIFTGEATDNCRVAE